MTIALLTLVTFSGFGQDNSPYAVWRLIDLGGYLGVRGFYREQYRKIGSIEENSQYPFLYGGIGLNTKSYIGHPNLLLLKINGEYNPGTNNQRYTVSPDRSEVMNISRLEMEGTIFDSKPINLVGYLNLGSNILNREYVSSSKTKSKSYGGRFNWHNKILPVSVGYNSMAWDQLEVDTDRRFFNEQQEFFARATKSFTKFGDRNEISYRYNDLFRREASSIETFNEYRTLMVNNLFYLDEHKRFSVQSFLNNVEQKGTIDQTRFQYRASADLQLPWRFRLGGSYEIFNVDQVAQSYDNTILIVNLNHQLFESLRTDLYYDDRFSDNTAFDESNLRFGGSIDYLKKIPTGTLNLNYAIRRHFQDVIADPNGIITVIDEGHILTDGQVELLNRPYVQEGTIVVKDATGSIIYQEGLDYLVIQQGVFTEIARVPGGLIPNNASLLIDYVAQQIGSYSLDGLFHALTIRFNILHNHLELYSIISKQDFTNVSGSELVAINYFDRYVYGVRLNLWKFSGGVERDEYNSSIVPYEKWRYFLNLNGQFGKKVLVSLNGDVTDQIITFDRDKQLFANAFGKVVYMIQPKTRVNFDFGYRKQVGNQIDLDMITGRAELNTVFRNLYMRFGLEVYKRTYINEKLEFRGIYFRIDRRF